MDTYQRRSRIEPGVLFDRPVVAGLAYVGGGLAVLVASHLQASATRSAEITSGQPTMAPALTIFFGIVLAPVGGLAALALAAAIRRTI